MTDMTYYPRYARYTLQFGLSALLIASALGCGKEDTKDGTPRAAKVVAGPPKLATINSALPAAIKGKLAFELVTIDNKLQAAVPKGWEPSKHIPGQYRPGEANEKMGFFTTFRVGSNCDGRCESKDWAPIVQRAEFSNLDLKTIDKDEPLTMSGATGRIVVAHDDETTDVIAVWWKAGASRYFYCRAILEEDAVSAAAAFETACRQTRVLNW